LFEHHSYSSHKHLLTKTVMNSSASAWSTWKSTRSPSFNWCSLQNYFQPFPILVEWGEYEIRSLHTTTLLGPLRTTWLISLDQGSKFGVKVLIGKKHKKNFGENRKLENDIYQMRPSTLIFGQPHTKDYVMKLSDVFLEYIIFSRHLTFCLTNQYFMLYKNAWN